MSRRLETVVALIHGGASAHVEAVNQLGFRTRLLRLQTPVPLKLTLRLSVL